LNLGIILKNCLIIIGARLFQNLKGSDGKKRNNQYLFGLFDGGNGAE
jgi:hypothetical protein